MNELYHHGILGQRWGRKNGPPYPLDAKDHSASERKAGWRRSLDKGSTRKDNSKRGLTDKQKRAILIGVGLAAAGLATYGAYRAGYLDSSIIKSGSSQVQGMANDHIRNIKDMLDQQYSSLGDAKRAGLSAKEAADKASQKLRNLSSSVPLQPKKINESIDNSLMKANPLYGTKEGTNNCVPSSIAGILRTMGLDVTAKSTGGKQLNPGGILEECFKGIKVKDGSATSFGRTRADAERILVNKFGQNAKGIVGIQVKNSNGSGHAFSWVISNGKVSFFDFQKGWNDSTVSSFWGRVIDPNGYLTLARLDNVEINYDNLKKYVDF